jgi:hypothetical protein
MLTYVKQLFPTGAGRFDLEGANMWQQVHPAYNVPNIGSNVACAFSADVFGATRTMNRHGGSRRE